MCLVTDGPEVEAERATVHTGIGLEAQLVCIVHAEPPPQVSRHVDVLNETRDGSHFYLEHFRSAVERRKERVNL